VTQNELDKYKQFIDTWSVARLATLNVAYALSYRDLEELIQERGSAADHSTVQRWVAVLRNQPTTGVRL
jgi:transposase-like protein